MTKAKETRFKGARKGVVVLTVLVAAAASAIGAYAYFSTSGTGNGTATVASPTPWTVTGGSAAGNLFPGSAPIDVTGGQVKNVSPGSMGLTKVVATITGTNAGPSCTATNFAFVSPGATWTLSAGNTVATISGSPLADVPPGGTYAMHDLQVEMVETGASQNACADAGINFGYAVS